MPDVLLDDLIGLPYERGARGPHSYDCYGYCMEICYRAGISLPEIDTPQDNDQRDVLFVSTKNVWRKLPRPQPWCIAAFIIHRHWHAGVVLPACAEFMHIMQGISGSRSRLDRPRWRQKLDGFYVPDNPDTQSL